MPFTKPNEENKISITITQNASSILHEDRISFNTDSLSGFINRIFKNFKDSADASITLALKKRREELTLLFKDLETDTRKGIISILEAEHKELLATNIQKNLQKIPGIPKTSFKVRINKENIEYLTSEPVCKENTFYKDHIGRYISALVEEYTQKTTFHREAIYFKEEIETITSAISNNCLLKAKLRRKDSFIPIYISPCSIVPDSHGLYHYLLGYHVKDNNDTLFKKPYSYRLSRLYDLKKVSGQKTQLTKADRDLIHELLQSNGAQFISSTNCPIKVQLSPRGMKKYLSIQHLRPSYTNKYLADQNNPDGDMILEFNTSEEQIKTTESQIEFYFFKFGKDALILEPLELRNRFLEMYKDAAEKYLAD